MLTATKTEKPIVGNAFDARESRFKNGMDDIDAWAENMGNLMKAHRKNTPRRVGGYFKKK